jgi:bifunctional DNA-binding transcriptional regulator/antitoxin component of YhaV-PrlF toxin-antitoxin module
MGVRNIRHLNLNLTSQSPSAAAVTLDITEYMDFIFSMITTVTTKNMITIPAAISREFGIRPGYRLAWRTHGQQLLVDVIPDRAGLADRLVGAGRRFSPERDAVRELVDERTAEC